MLNIPALVIRTGIRAANDVEVEEWNIVLYVTFRPESRKKLAGAADAVSCWVGSTADFPKPAYNVRIFKDPNVKNNVSWDIVDFTSKDDRGRSALQRAQKRCRTYSLSVPFDVRFVQEVIKSPSAVAASAGGDEESLSGLN